MVFAGLSLDQAPPYSVTMKFFITGFVYAFFGGVYLAINGGVFDVIFIHLMTIGFMTMVMSGAVLQFLPVVGGITFKRIKLLSNLIYIGLNLGVIGFVVGFYLYNLLLLRMSAFILSFSITLFAMSVIYKVFTSKTKNLSILSIAFALLFLFLGMLAGVWMLHSHASINFDESFLQVKNLHLLLLFFGWILLLVMGVSFQVIPMFWVAKDFSPKSKAVFIFLMAGLLLLNLFFATFAFLLLLLLLGAVYAVAMMHRLYKRKRKLSDCSVKYWFVAMASLLIVMLFLIFDVATYLSYKIAAFGFVYGVISAMIYKIIPFITWFHLSAKGIFEIPTMKEMIAQKQIEYGFYLFLITYFALIFTPLSDRFETLFIATFIILNLLHLVNFLKVIVLYKNIVLIDIKK